MCSPSSTPDPTTTKHAPRPFMHARVQVYGVAGSVEKTSTYLRHAAVSLFVGTLRKYIPTPNMFVYFPEPLPLYLSVAPLPFQKTKIKQQKKLDLEMRTARLRLREMIDQAKTQEREAILNEERKRHESSSGTGAFSGTNGGAASPGPGPRPGSGSGSGSGSAAASYDAKMANGSSMGRRTQSSTGAPFAPRRASTGTGAGESTERGKRPQDKLGRSGAQPKPIDQMRQTFVEDTLTDFFGL